MLFGHRVDVAWVDFLEAVEGRRAHERDPTGLVDPSEEKRAALLGTLDETALAREIQARHVLGAETALSRLVGRRAVFPARQDAAADAVVVEQEGIAPGVSGVGEVGRASHGLRKDTEKRLE